MHNVILYSRRISPFKKGLFFLLVIGLLPSCNNVTYSVHGAKKKYFARPSILFMDAVVNYRTANHFWPASMRDLALNSEQNRQLVEAFKYNYVDFKIADSNHLRILFNGYKKDADNPSTKDKIDLNSLRGEMRFFDIKNGFGWKLKMK